jgi:hypothetical protein
MCGEMPDVLLAPEGLIGDRRSGHPRGSERRSGCGPCVVVVAPVTSWRSGTDELQFVGGAMEAAAGDQRPVASGQWPANGR